MKFHLWTATKHMLRYDGMACHFFFIRGSTKGRVIFTECRKKCEIRGIRKTKWPNCPRGSKGLRKTNVRQFYTMSNEVETGECQSSYGIYSALRPIDPRGYRGSADSLLRLIPAKITEWQLCHLLHNSPSGRKFPQTNCQVQPPQNNSPILHFDTLQRELLLKGIVLFVPWKFMLSPHLWSSWL